MLYRPLVSLSFAVDYSFWELNPLGYHLTNLFFHILVCLVFYFFSKIILEKNMEAALLASLIFASHPVHSESVAWIFGRTDLIAGFFFLTAFYLYVLYKDKRKAFYLIVSLLVFAMALFSKEMAATLPFIVILYDLIFEKSRNSRKRWLPVAGYFVILAGYLFARHKVLGELTLPAQIQYSDFFYHLPWAIMNYLRLLFIPLNLSALHALPDKGDTGTLLIYIFLIGVIAALTIIVFRRDKRLFFLLAWIYITILPVMNRITMASATPVAERFLYIPSIGYALLIGYAFIFWGRHKKVVVSVLTGLILLFSAQTFYRNRVWSNEGVFFADMIENAPTTYRGYYNLGNYYYELGKLDTAIILWEKTLAVNPRMYAVRNNLGVIYEKRKLYDKAIAEYRKILAVKDYPEVHFNLGNVLIKQEHYKDAIDELHSALKGKPMYPEASYNLAMTYEDSGQFTEALKWYKETIRLKPDNPAPHNNLGILYAKMGDKEKAAGEFRLALKCKPDDYEAYYNLSLLSNRKP